MHAQPPCIQQAPQVSDSLSTCLQLIHRLVPPTVQLRQVSLCCLIQPLVLACVSLCQSQKQKLFLVMVLRFLTCALCILRARLDMIKVDMLLHNYRLMVLYNSDSISVRQPIFHAH